MGASANACFSMIGTRDTLRANAAGPLPSPCSPRLHVANCKRLNVLPLAHVSAVDTRPRISTTDLQETFGVSLKRSKWSLGEVRENLSDRSRSAFPNAHLSIPIRFPESAGQERGPSDGSVPTTRVSPPSAPWRLAGMASPDRARYIINRRCVALTHTRPGPSTRTDLPEFPTP